MFDLLKDSFFHFVALALGFRTFRYHTPFFRILFYQIIVAGIILAVSFIPLEFTEKLGIQSNNNLWAFNLYILIESILLSIALRLLIKGRSPKIYWITGISFVLLILFVQCYNSGIGKFYNYAAMAEGIYIVSLLLIIFFQNSVSEEPDGQSRIEFWPMLGLLVYFAGYSPYMGMFNYLNENHAELSSQLYYIFVIGLSQVRYLLLVIGFWKLMKFSQSATA